MNAALVTELEMDAKPAAMNAALVTELEMDAKPASMIATKNRACEFFIQKAKLKNLNPITCMGSLGLNSS